MLGPQSSVIRPRDTSAHAGSRGPPPNVFPKMCMPHKPRFISCVECAAPRRGMVRAVSRQRAHHGQFVGWAGQVISMGQRSVRLGHEARGINRDKMMPVCRLPQRRADERTMAAVPPAFTQALHTSIFSYILLHLPSC